VSPDVSDIQRRRLEASGWELVEFRSGKSLWRRPEGGRLYTLKSALKHANRQERGELEAAGWEAVEGERDVLAQARYRTPLRAGGGDSVSEADG
jgi:hypothetical protein